MKQELKSPIRPMSAPEQQLHARLTRTLEWTNQIMYPLIDLAFRLLTLASTPVLLCGLILITANFTLNGALIHAWPWLFIAWAVAQIVAINLNFLTLLVEAIEDRAPAKQARSLPLWRMRYMVRLTVVTLLAVVIIGPLVLSNIPGTPIPTWLAVLRDCSVFGILFVNALLSPQVKRQRQQENEDYCGIPVTPSIADQIRHAERVFDAVAFKNLPQDGPNAHEMLVPQQNSAEEPEIEELEIEA